VGRAFSGLVLPRQRERGNQAASSASNLHERVMRAGAEAHDGAERSHRRLDDIGQDLDAIADLQSLTIQGRGLFGDHSVVRLRDSSGGGVLVVSTPVHRAGASGCSGVVSACGVGDRRTVNLGFTTHDRDRALSFHEAHVAAVQAAVPPERLLVFNLRERWAPLCDVLGVATTPHEAFPHVNDDSAFQRNLRGQTAIDIARSAAVDTVAALAVMLARIGLLFWLKPGRG
jgi:hypothetical protein